jgi:hypothetical protein
MWLTRPAQFATTALIRTVEVALALPRIALALERLASTAEELRALTDVAPAIRAIGALANDARRLIGDQARYEELMAAVAAIIRLGDMATTVGPLGDAVKQLNLAATTLVNAVAPLQGAGDLLGRFVERMPVRPPRPADTAGA